MSDKACKFQRPPNRNSFGNKDQELGAQNGKASVGSAWPVSSWDVAGEKGLQRLFEDKLFRGHLWVTPQTLGNGGFPKAFGFGKTDTGPLKV